MVRPVVSPSKWLPELDNRALAFALLALGTIGLVAELTSTLFPGRMALYMIVFAAGVFGVVRRHRRMPRALTRS